MRKFLFFIALAICCNAMAEKTIVTSGYCYGMVASFKDSTVYITEIQSIDSLYMNSKTGFILGRDNYSLQLKYYVESTFNEKHKTCIFVYDLKRKNLQKKYDKMMKKYKSGTFIVKNINESDFKFTPVDMSESVPQNAPEKTKKEKAKKK